MFLTRAPGNLLDQDEIHRDLKHYLRTNLMQAAVGWETLYEMPEEALVIVSSDLAYLKDALVDQALDQAVVVSRNRVVVVPRRTPATSRQCCKGGTRATPRPWCGRSQRTTTGCSTTSRSRGSRPSSGPGLVVPRLPYLTTWTARSRGRTCRGMRCW